MFSIASLQRWNIIHIRNFALDQNRTKGQGQNTNEIFNWVRWGGPCSAIHSSGADYFRRWQGVFAGLFCTSLCQFKWQVWSQLKCVPIGVIGKCRKGTTPWAYTNFINGTLPLIKWEHNLMYAHRTQDGLVKNHDWSELGQPDTNRRVLPAATNERQDLPGEFSIYSLSQFVSNTMLWL